MKITSGHTKEVWESGDYAGNTRRPTARATIQKLTAPHPQYRLEEERTVDKAHHGYYQSLLFGQKGNVPRELPNIQSLKWSRGVDTDVGTCTIVLANVEIRNDRQPASSAELDFPGYFTPNRGTETYFDQWGYPTNEWKNWLVPDRIIRTYEGYGVSPKVAPEKDPHLYPSGVWLVDDVDINANDGTITLTCRDLGRALLDQVMFPPAVPWGAYPVTFEPYEHRGKSAKAVTGTWKVPTYDTDSNMAYRNKGVKDDDGSLVVDSDGSVMGHHGRDAFDYSTFTYWFSTGYRSRDSREGYVYLQGNVPSGSSVEGVKVDANSNGAAQLYISLQRTDGTWIGRKRIPYKAGAVNTGANIPYVMDTKIKVGETLSIKLPKKYTGIKRIRYTFGHLPWTAAGYNLNHRIGINKVYYAEDVSMTTIPGAFAHGNYADYSDVVKWLLAWAGWFWPGREQAMGEISYSDGSTVSVIPERNDPALVNGRVWGDFEMTGTKGLPGTKLDVDVFDKKPFMDGIAAVREIVGFDFWIDETGAAIWRLPNVFKRGNYAMPDGKGNRAARTKTLVEIDERTTMTELQVKLSGKNIRELIYIGNKSGGKGAVVRGYYPDYTGMRRIAGWTDQQFGSNDECERMADLIALRQSFTYRQNSVTIAANPAIQPDDQVIITERTTGEGYIHRVLNISSDFDAETGQWTYQLTTNWLGSRAFTNLAYDPKYLRNVTKFYIKAMGRL